MNPIIVAHRGGALEAPENSLAAFRHALSTRCHSIEADLRATRDGEIVVLHDETLDRTAVASGRLKDRTLSQLRSVRLKNGEPVPTLSALLRLAAGKISLHLEVKEAGFEEKLARLLHEAKIVPDVWVISFLPEVLVKLLEINPGVPTGFLFDTQDAWKNCPPGCAVALPWAPLLEPPLIEALRARNMGIHTWVVNDLEVLGSLKPFHPDAVITDRPRAFMDFLAKA